MRTTAHRHHLEFVWPAVRCCEFPAKLPWGFNGKAREEVPGHPPLKKLTVLLKVVLTFVGTIFLGIWFRKEP